jgi:serine/threonine protein kinase
MINNDGICFDINIVNNLNIKIKDDLMIGKGAYGNVFYIGELNGKKCVIKISLTEDNNNKYEIENYFYIKYESNSSCIKSLPSVLYIGKTENKLDSKKYDYIILEYVGVYNLCKIFNNIFNPKSDASYIVNILYNCLYIQLRSIHKTNIVYRDISPANIVISDMITSFLMKKYFSFNNDIQSELYKCIPQNITIEDIINKFIDKKYDELVKFVDAGIFCDLDVIDNINKYDADNIFICGNFYEFDDLDGLFGSTIEYTSPFCIFDFSSLICKIENKSNIRKLIKNLLKLSDIWSLNIVFTIYLFNIVTKNNYHGYINNQLSDSPIIYANNLNNNTFLRMPFYFSSNTFCLSRNLEYVLNFNFSGPEIEIIKIQRTLKHCLDKIIGFVNYLVINSVKQKWRYFVKHDSDTILDIYEKSELCLSEINVGFVEFHEKMRDFFLELNRCKE